MLQLWSASDMSIDGMKALATAVLQLAFQDKDRRAFAESDDMDFWCEVAGIEPALVRSRCAAR